MTEFGLMLVIVGGNGAGSTMVNIKAFDSLPTVPILCGGLKTVTLAVPCAAKSEAGMLTVSVVPLTYMVGRSALFHRTTEEFKKFAPVTVMVVPGVPA